jgi:hypothetical protein
MSGEGYYRINQDRAGLQRMDIEPIDIKAIRSGWLTDTGIREIVARFGNLTSSRVNIVDPVWFSAWIREGGRAPGITPVFFKPHPGVRAVTGLAIPFNEGGNHWTTLYIDLEKCGGIYFNTMPDIERDNYAKKLMLQFYDVFREFFVGKGQKNFEFVVDDNCAEQDDAVSCGIYVTAAVIDLLAMARPRTQSLTHEQIRIFRENGVKWLSEALENREKSFNFLLPEGTYHVPELMT